MDFTPYLSRTDFLDFDHPRVQQLVREVPPGDDPARAAALFLLVRDGVRYDPYGISLEPAHFAASATLERKRGYCVTKAILYAAGLRGLGIPARLGFADVRNHLATPQLIELMRTDVFSYHGYAEVWLGGRWLKATPAFNASLCLKFGAPPLEFDGEHDAVLQAVNSKGDRFMDYLKDRGTFADFSLEKMLEAWREVYPHFFVGEEPLRGDFEREIDGLRRA